MNLNLNNDTAVMRGVRTGIQAIGGFVVGLLLTIWQVPGVPVAVHSYVSQNAMQVLLTLGIPAVLGSGVLAFVWNYFRADVPTK